MNSTTKPGDLTIQYGPWIRKIVRRMWSKYSQHYDYTELLAIAHVASLEAEKKYDPKKAKFSSYVKPRIEGAIINSVSSISNSQHKILVNMYKFIESYIQQHDMPPAQHLILEHLKIDVARFDSLLETSLKVTMVSPDDLDEGDLSVDMDMDTLAEYAKVDAIIKTLTNRQQDKIREFLEDNVEPSADLQVILDIIRDKLNIKVEA